jgi:hypothetical protein
MLDLGGGCRLESFCLPEQEAEASPSHWLEIVGSSTELSPHKESFNTGLKGQAFRDTSRLASIVKRLGSCDRIDSQWTPPPVIQAACASLLAGPAATWRHEQQNAVSFHARMRSRRLRVIRDKFRDSCRIVWINIQTLLIKLDCSMFISLA